MTVDQEFSRFLKVQKGQYIYKEKIDWERIDSFLEQLSLFDLYSLDTDQKKKSFWINLYNGLTNYWIIKKGIKKKMKEDPRIFVYYKVNIGGLRFSLDNIEHGILRRNTRTSYWPFSQFMFWDRRRKLLCDEVDYRIHFALNCGANSCPVIAFYNQEQIETLLDLATSNFVGSEFEVNEKSKTISCSRIFSWYKKDFSNEYLNDPKYREYKIVLKPYDWSIH